jgi:hypothetical protein
MQDVIHNMTIGEVEEESPGAVFSETGHLAQ